MAVDLKTSCWIGWVPNTVEVPTDSTKVPNLYTTRWCWALSATFPPGIACCLSIQFLYHQLSCQILGLTREMERNLKQSNVVIQMKQAWIEHCCTQLENEFPFYYPWTGANHFYWDREKQLCSGNTKYVYDKLSIMWVQIQEVGIKCNFSFTLWTNELCNWC